MAMYSNLKKIEEKKEKEALRASSNVSKEKQAPPKKSQSKKEVKTTLSAFQNASKPDFQHASMLEIQKPSMPASQTSGNTALQQTSIPANRHNLSPSEKVTYRFHPEGKYAIEDMKTILARKHGVKASLEEIAEEAILLVYEDLLENQNASKLANRLSRNTETQKAS